MTTSNALIVGRIAAPQGKRVRKPRAHSRNIALGDIDGRLREAKLMRDLVEELTAHCGGKPSAVQRQLIQRASVLHLRLALMDDKTKAGVGMTEKLAREYLAWHNSYCRTLRLLGLQGTSPRVPTLADILSAVPAKPEVPAKP